MTNAILKRLVQKGWLNVKKINNRNIQYIVSVKGVEHITKMGYRYLRRTIKNVVYYKETIAKFVKEVSIKGFKGIVLVGPSDLDFIVEHLCLRNNLHLTKSMSISQNENKFGEYYFILSEELTPDLKMKEAEWASLRDILIDT